MFPDPQNSQAQEEAYYQNNYIICSSITSMSSLTQLHPWAPTPPPLFMRLSVAPGGRGGVVTGLGERITEN